MQKNMTQMSCPFQFELVAQKATPIFMGFSWESYSRGNSHAQP